MRGHSKVKLYLNNRLTMLNQGSFAENIPKTAMLYISITTIGCIYFAIAYSLFHTLWYHKLFALISSIIFAFSLQDLYFESIEKRVKQALPKATKKLAHYYVHHRGNVIASLKETEERCTIESRNYIVKIRKALQASNPSTEIALLKDSFPIVWYKLLASIAFMAKEKGSGGNSGSDNLIGSNLMRITNILSFINVQQGYNDAELRYIQLFLYFAPFLFIYASDWINGRILLEMNMQDIYLSIKAQNLKSYIFMASNLSALFIHWMRKQQL